MRRYALYCLTSLKRHGAQRNASVATFFIILYEPRSRGNSPNTAILKIAFFRDVVVVSWKK